LYLLVRKSAKDIWASRFAIKILNSIKVTDDTMRSVMEAKKTIEDQLSAKPDNILAHVNVIQTNQQLGKHPKCQ
jgi:hypothetical protein